MTPHLYGFDFEGDYCTNLYVLLRSTSFSGLYRIKTLLEANPNDVTCKHLLQFLLKKTNDIVCL